MLLRPRLFACASFAWTALAAAAEPPVLIALDRCEELDQVEVRRVFVAELGVRSAEASGPGVTEATVICQGPRVIVRVYDPLSRKLLQRSFSLSRADRQARPRLVSIAAAELVLASWAELGTNPEPEVEPDGPPPEPETARAARTIVKLQTLSYESRAVPAGEADAPPDRMFRLAALASARQFFNYSGTLVGGGLRIGEERLRWLSWSADALFETGSLDGDNHYDVYTATVGGHLFVSGRVGRLTARVGAGLRAGLASAATETGNGVASLAPWGWPLAATSLSFKVSEAFVLELAAEGGYVRLPVQGRAERLIEGGWISGQAGVAVIPWGAKGP